MPYALIPDGYSLKQVTKLQKQAVDEKRRHDNVMAFLNNETTPLLIGGIGAVALTPLILNKLINTVEVDLGISLTEEQKKIINASLLINPVTGPFVISKELVERFFGDK